MAKAKKPVAKKANNRGRPKAVLSDEQISQIEELSDRLTTEQIADYLGIGRTTFYALMQRDPRISERYKRGRAKAIVSVCGSLRAKIDMGDTTAMLFYLKTQAGWRETGPEIDAAMPEPIEYKIRAS